MLHISSVDFSALSIFLYMSSFGAIHLEINEILSISTQNYHPCSMEKVLGQHLDCHNITIR